MGPQGLQSNYYVNLINDVSLIDNTANPVYRQGNFFYIFRTERGETMRPVSTRYDNKVMGLVKKKIYLFINYNVVTFTVHPLYLHTPFPAVLPLFVAFTEHKLWDVFSGLRYSPLDVYCLTQNGVLSLPILLFEIKRSRRVRDQVSKGRYTHSMPCPCRAHAVPLPCHAVPLRV